MKLYRLTFIILTILPIHLSFGQKSKRVNVLNDFIAKTSIDKSSHRTIRRIIYDFNSDGIADVALSDLYDWGNAGGKWLFYFGSKDRTYHYYDEIEVMHSSAYGIQKQKGKPNILSFYWRMSAGSGGLFYFLITKKGFKKLKIIEIKDVTTDFKDKFIKWRIGIETEADLKCLILKKNGCWNKVK